MWEFSGRIAINVFFLYSELWKIAFDRGYSWYYHDEFSREEIAEILRQQDGVDDIDSAINICVERDWLDASIIDAYEPFPEIFYKVTERGKIVYNALRP
ncbi:MAG: hypothetical protein HY813_03605 [Candidatus Portnoybacteria bacterium]|nr:hypothetical protein [Candidatus Portnoybacteria bacterium]